MYAVIFRATIACLDSDYQQQAAELRDRAIDQFACLEFVSSTQGDQEVAISYWPSEAAIRAWHQDEVHRQAQALGAQKWYRDYGSNT